jgi:xylulokinase
VTPVSGSLTVGIDIGTTSVKALAVDGDGTVVARARVPHRVVCPAPDLLEHDAVQAWRRNPIRALRSVSPQVRDLAGVCVASMVPSLTVVDRKGIPRAPGLLYTDARGRRYFEDERDPDEHSVAEMMRRTMPDAEGFLRWAVHHDPDARGYWPAQAVANYALGGVPAIDTAMAVSMTSLMAAADWDDDKLARLGTRASQLPVVVPMAQAAGTLRGSDAVFTGGTVDAFCDQLVAGADDVGDVLVLCGATLVVWVVVREPVEAKGLWTIPHHVPDRVLVGGPSNAGALFVDWARSLVRGVDGEVQLRGGHDRELTDEAEPARSGDPERVPVWTPYLRGERAPYHDSSLRSTLHGLDITHDPGAVTRAAYEATGFVVRRMLEHAGISARRIVASGGGTRNLQWMQAMADATGLPVDVVAVPEGAALGAAYVARMAAGLESGLEGARRWARTGRRIEPDARWHAAANDRFARFVELGPAL